MLGLIAHPHILQLYQQSSRVLYNIADDFIGYIQYLSDVGADR